MRIGIITDHLDIPFGTGTGTYTYNLVKQLNKIDHQNEYSLIHHTQNDVGIYQANKEVLIPKLNIPYGVLIWRLGNLPLKLKKMKFDVVHDLILTGPLDFKMPFKKVGTIFDMTPLLFPETQSILPNFFFKRFSLPRAKKLDKIITDSENSRQDIVRLLGISAEKIEVIHDGVDTERFTVLDNTNGVVRKYCLDFPFILSVSVLEPRKNLPRLIKAFHKLKRHGLPHKLVIAGGKGWRCESIFATVEELNLKDEVVFLGFVPDENLPALYNAADLFACPSLYEGCPLPPLEAMACGTPTVTSNTSSFPEVIEDAGIMVDPYDIDALATAMHDVLVNNELKQRLIHAGLEKAKEYTWERVARKTLKVYEEVYRGD